MNVFAMNKKSIVWNFFRKIEETKFVKCLLCQKEYSFCNNTTNLRDHLLRKHSEELSKAYQSQDPRDISSSNVAGTSSSEVLRIKPRGTVKNLLDRDVFYDESSSRKKCLDKIFTKMIAVDMEPLRIGEHEGFKEFVKALDPKYRIPDTSTLSTKLLPQLYRDLKVRVMQAVTECSHISITADMWTSTANEGILAITGHFVHGGKLESPLIAAVKVEGSHNAAKISKVSGRFTHSVF